MGPRYHRAMRLLLLAGFAAVGLKILVWWLEPRMAFFPTRGVQETPASARQPFVDLRIPTDDGETLHAWWLEHPQPSAQVLFFHGNGGNLSMWLDVVVELRRRGFSVLAVDYRGYGDSTGRPTERGRVSGCGRGGAPLQRASPAPRQSGDLLGPIARQRRGGVGRVTRRLRCPRAGESLSGHASGLCREPGDAAADRVFVVPISHLEVHRTIRAAAARHPRRRRFDHPVRGRQARVRPRAGRPKDADHDSACRPQRSARGESGDVLAGDRRVRRFRATRLAASRSGRSCWPIRPSDSTALSGRPTSWLRVPIVPFEHRDRV